jgi:capsular polysaccharide biosynthesis protein
MNGLVQHPVAATAIAESSRKSRRTIVSAGGYSRQPPFHLDMDLAQHSTVEFLVECTKVLDANHEPIEAHELVDALVCGQGAVVTRNNELLRDSVLEFLALGAVADGLAAAEGGFRIVPEVTKVIEEPCILAKRPWFRNFGHWIVDAAALLALTAETCRAEGLTIVVGDVGIGPLRHVMIETIGHILPGSQILFHPDDETWRFRALKYVTPVHVPPLFKLPIALSKLRDAILPDWSKIEPFRKIFVVRGTGPHVRALCNSDQIMELCMDHGYRLVAPESLPIHEAARVFAEATAVIGVKGAALTNALFCRPGTAVMALSPADFPDPFFWDLLTQRGVRYGEVFGAMTSERHQGHNDFVIEPSRLERMLDAADHVAEKSAGQAGWLAEKVDEDAAMPTIPNAPAVPRNVQDLVRCFESLGDNCEFGLVQRFAGIEPPGLFRFNLTELASLVAGLMQRFSDLALPGQVQLEWTTGEWIVRETVYGFGYHTFNRDPSLDQDHLKREQGQWMRYMADKFLEQLAVADRIFVRKGDSPCCEGEIRALHTAMRTFGNATLLWVCQADADHAAGEVEWLDPGLMRGWISAFAPYDDAMNVDPVGWLQLCRRAWALAYLGDADKYPGGAEIGPGALNFGGWSGSAVATSEFAWEVPPAPAGGHVMRHHLIADTPQAKDIFGCLVSTGLKPGGLYTASVCIRLPEDFAGTNVGLVMLGRPSLRRGQLDFQLRDAWQRLSVSAFLGPEETLAFPRLVVSGPRGTTVFSADWRLEADTIPA